MKVTLEINAVVPQDQGVSDNTNKNSNLRNGDNEMDSGNSTNRANESLTTAKMAANGILHLLILLVIGTVAYFAFANGVRLFAWHPTLMLTGFLLLMTEAVLAFNNNSYVAQNLNHNLRLTLHWILQVGAATCIIVAFLAIYFHKVNEGYPHFSSWHSNLGLYTDIFTFGTIGGGVLAKYGYQLRNVLRPVVFKIIHASFGVITYSLAILTICFGLNTDWFRLHVSQGWINVLVGCVVLIWVIVIPKPIITILSRVGGGSRAT